MRRPFPRQVGLRGRILAAGALATLVPVVLVGGLAVRRAGENMKREVVRGNLALVRALGLSLDGSLQDARRTLAVAAAAWAADEPGAAEGEGADGPAGGRARRLFSRVKREVPIVRRLAVFDAEGRFAAGDPVAVDLEVKNTYGGYLAEGCGWAERGADRAPRGAEDDCSSAQVVVQARGRTGELRGFLVAELDLAFVGQALVAARLGAGARLWVVDSRGQPVAASGASVLGRRPRAEAVERALASADDGSLEIGGGAERVLAVYRNLGSFQTTRGVGWAVVLEQPTSEAYALARATARDTLLAGAAVLLVGLLLAGAVASRLTRPLRDLTAHADALGAGAAAPPPLPVEAPGEIGALARRFGEMERRVAERERLQAELARGAQLASVGALAAGVAHEINNPLTTILGYTNLLLEDARADSPDREALALCAEEARRVQGIVRTLLDHARAETGPVEREPVDVSALVERTAALVTPTLRKRGVRLSIEVPSNLPRPVGSPRRLQQVLVNLAQNAAQAMEGGGTLAIRGAATGAGGVAIDVEDSGPGIPEDQLPRIFEPFFTTKGPGVGTGLGLAISHQIVREHGGRIEVVSQVGRGSTFRVILGEPPAAERAASGHGPAVA